MRLACWVIWAVSTGTSPVLLDAPFALAATPATAPSTRPAGPNLPHLEVDLAHHRVRMDCQAVNAEMALEFLVCMTGTAEHETALRSSARPSHLHLALLMIGLEPGRPVQFLENPRRRIAPTGPRLKISCEFTRDGRLVREPAYRLMRHQKSHKELQPTTWVFTGSRLTPQGDYAADLTGHLVSVVNFPFTPVDIPDLKSNNNETLELEVNPDVAPPRGTRVWLIFEKAP